MMPERGNIAGEAATVPAWHTLSVEEIARRLDVNPVNGLAHDGVQARALRYGANEIREFGRRGLREMVAAQFKDFMILILIAAALVSAALGDAGDTIVIVAIVVLNGLVGFVQDWRAERAMTALKQLAAPHATVVRAGEQRRVAAADIVPGDIVLLEAGSAVPADLRLVEAPRLKIVEAALTGEAVPVEKSVEPLADVALPLADRTNMAFKGTIATYGRARGIAVATGMATELGRIASMIEAVPRTQTPLQRRLAVFGRQLAIAILVICIVIFAAGLLRGEPIVLMLLTALSLAVAAIPEALPAVVTVMLAVGARSMAGRNALVRRLPAVETLGSVSCICTDKTGTLTLNEMHATTVYLEGRRFAAPDLDPADPPVRQLLTALALCNDASGGERGEWVGDPTETALVRISAGLGLVKSALEQAMPRVLELPFDSERKRMTTVHHSGDGFIAYTKGAPEAVLDRCAAVEASAISAAAEAMAKDGLRVLAVACRHWDSLPSEAAPDTIERHLTLLGLVGLLDPPRPEAKDAIARCKTAGIIPIMITGDHPVTARAIANSLGMLAPGDMVMTGAELQNLTGAELAARAAQVRVYARVDPAQKIRIVEAIQADGRFVAMTGDGVNDAPALARADIGVAMGKSGTDVARESASLVLLDDNFATIVAAVAEGRRIFDNIRKVISYILTCNAAEIWTLLLAPFLGLPLPLLPIQILWINLVTDGLPALALAAEPAGPDIMRRSPRPPGESIFAAGLWQHILWIGLAMGGLTLLTQAYAIHVLGTPRWQTMVFLVLTLSQLCNVLAVRSEHESLVRHSLLSNRMLVGTVLLTTLLQLAVIYVPALNLAFETAPLTTPELVACVVISAAVFVPIEGEKWLARRRLIYR